jgi:chemotaxis protein MotB
MPGTKNALLAFAVLATACVSSGKYQAALEDATDARSELERVSASQRNEIADLQRRIAELRHSMDDASALGDELRAELQRRGTDVDALLAEKGELSSALVDSRARLEALRRAQAASEARARLFQELAMRLKKMVDAGDLSIVLRDGRMVLQLPTDVLFDTARVQIKPRGKDALQEVAAVLSTMGERRFLVTGHTDNVPIANERFRSNWDLSTGRALEVVQFLIAQGVPPRALAAAGYGEFDPIASNDTPDERQMNRRIEIALQPNVDEMVALPDTESAQASR